MFCLLLPTTKCKQQQIAILIISFFLYVDGIRNEGNNMLQQLQQQQPIENSNYQSPSSSNSVFKPSPLIEFTLADVNQMHGFKAFEDSKYPTSIPATPTSPDTSSGGTTLRSDTESFGTKIETQNDNRRYSTLYTNGEQQFPFPNEQQQQQQHGFLPQQQYQDQQQQQHEHFTQQLTEMPIYIYKDPYTNENYHYTPTEANNKDVVVTAASSPTYTHNNYNGNGYQQQHQQRPQYQTAAVSALQDNQEYLVHSSMLVGTQHASSPYVTSGSKDVYQKRPGIVYDESYVSHPNAVLEKKSDGVAAAAKKTNKISYDSHDYPPPSYHQQQTSNFLPTPAPEEPPTPRPTAPPVRPPPSVYYTTPTPPPARPPPNYYATPSAQPPNRSPPSYASHRPPLSDDYRPRPSPPFGGQQYLQSSQNALPNYANNLDNYLSNKQQTEYYRPEQPPAAYYQQQQQQQHRETIPPPFRQQQQQQYQQSPASYPPFGQHQQQQQSSYPSYQPPAPPPSSQPSYNNYYDYQIGEVPPQTQGAFNYPYSQPPPPPNGPFRPPYVPPTTTQQPSGLATLVQYAPQFTSLLLGGGGGGSSSNTNNPLGSLLLGALTGGATSPQSSSANNRRPINSQLIKALENIARNDDLQCVPRVLCQMIAAQTQRGQLPSFITSPTITNFLAGFPAMSPAIIYGRAALLGISGGEKSCRQTYLKCPKNEIEIINYLNNHRGGFFKFFSEPDEESFNQQNGNHDSSQSGATSLFSILSALTGTPAETVTTPRPRPKPQPQPASSDITDTIGNFFTNLLSDYMGGGATVEYQRRRKRSVADRRVRFEDEDDENFDFNQQPEEDYNDDEDTEDTQKNVEFVYEPEYNNDEEESVSATEARVVHRPPPKGKRLKFFPETDSQAEGSERPKDDIIELVEKFNEFNKGRKLKFPSAAAERQYISVAREHLRDAKQLDDNKQNKQFNYGHGFTNYERETYDNKRDAKKVKFYNEAEGNEYEIASGGGSQENHDLNTAETAHGGSKIRFPEREGKILNKPYYAASFSYNRQQQLQSYEENENKFPNNQNPNEFREDNGQETNFYNDNGVSSNVAQDFPKPSNDYNQYNPPQRPENYYGYTTRPSAASIYNSHVTSVNSINNYLSNSATNHNYYGGSPTSSQGNSDSSYFLPTPAPDSGDIDNDYNNSLYPNNNFQANDQGTNQYSKHESNKSQRYTSSTSSSSSSNRQTYNNNRQTYNSHRRPSAGSSQSSSSFNSGNSKRYPSNSYNDSINNRYHSSLYTNRRTTTTPKPDNGNIYITNSRGETEYYIRPDGRKVYL